jgi:Exportin-T
MLSDESLSTSQHPHHPPSQNQQEMSSQSQYGFYNFQSQLQQQQQQQQQQLHQTGLVSLYTNSMDHNQQQQQQQQQQQVEQWILQSNNPLNPSVQREAVKILQQWLAANESTYTATPNSSITTLFQILQRTRHDIVQLYCLTNLGQLLVRHVEHSYNNIDENNINHMTISNNSSTLQESQHTVWRNDFRNFLLSTWSLQQQEQKRILPNFLLNKVASLLSKFFIQQVGISNKHGTNLSIATTTTTTTWTTVELDLLRLASQHPLLFVKTIECILEDFVIISADVSDHCSVGSTSCYTTTTIPVTNGIATTATIITTTAEQARHAKEYLKGYILVDGTETISTTRPNPTPLNTIFETVVSILSSYLVQRYGGTTTGLSNATNNSNENEQELVILCSLMTIKSFFVWTEMSFLGNTAVQRLLDILLHLVRCLPSPNSMTQQLNNRRSDNNSNHGPQQQLPLVSIEIGKATLDTWQEWMTSCSTIHPASELTSSIASIQDPKLPILQALLERIHECSILPMNTKTVLNTTISTMTSSNNDNSNNDEDDDDTDYIELIIQTAQLINVVGMEVLPLFLEQPQNVSTLFQEVLDLFFRALAYDDIDVSLAVIPLAIRLCPLFVEENRHPQQQQQQFAFSLLSHLPGLLNILYKQLKYPIDFTYDFEDEINSEEEQYRVELCKLFTKIVRVAPQTSLQFIVEAVASQLNILNNNNNSNSTTAARDVEATLRLLYVYCEGILPSPGLKIVMKNETFRTLLITLHQNSTTIIYPQQHPAVLCWYYDVSVRYYPIFQPNNNNSKAKDNAATQQHQDESGLEHHLLSNVLGRITGPSGLQHESIRVRSRCCYLFLRLVKSVVSMLRPFMETAVSGIQRLLEQSYSETANFELRPDDILHLFETMGVLLGKTGLGPSDQRKYLTAVMTPHVRNIEQILATPGLRQDVDHYSEKLSDSIGAIAHLSKGFTKQPAEEIQAVLVETVNITYNVLETVPSCASVRNKAMVLFQRMIYCGLGNQFMTVMPKILILLIEHCTTDDAIFVAQIFNQLCIKLKSEAGPAIESAIVPFVLKCHKLLQVQVDNVTIANPSMAPVITNSKDESVHDYVPPHLETEQLAIEKLLFVVIQHIVSNNVTAVLLSPTNHSCFGMILQTMSDGAIRVADPVVKKTCFRFFRELLEQWSSSNGGIVGNMSIVDSYRRDLCTFISEILVPGAFAGMLLPAFDVRDANQVRVVTELASVLFLIKERYSAVSGTDNTTSFYHQCLRQMANIMGQLATQDIMNLLDVSNSIGDIDRCILEIIKLSKSHQAK